MSLILKKMSQPNTKPTLGGLNKPKIGGLKKASLEPKEIDIEEKEETKVEQSVSIKPKIGGLKLKNLKAKEEEIESEEEMKENTEVLPTFTPAVTEETVETQEEVVEEKEDTSEVVEEVVEAEKEEATEQPVKETKTKKSTKKKKTTKKAKEEDEVIELLAVDESKRVSIEEMDSVMRPIVAPTLETWEQEKKDILAALNNIKVEQDMEMCQVKEALANLDELNFVILPKLHDAETMYDGTKQNYDTVKAIAIAKGSATNAEGRKAEGILACQNFVTPTGQVVDLHQYMLLIEERFKFYQKITEGINFKKYSLINYNNALKIENKN